LRILFVNQHYWPDVASTGQHLTDLAEHLAARGHEVHVLCARGAYVGGGAGLERRDTRNGVTIHRAWTPGLGRRSNAGRIAEYAAFYGSVLWRLLLGRRYAVVVLLTTPPLLPVAGAVVWAVRRRRYGVWSMDLHPDAEFALGMLRPTSLLGRALAGADARAVRRADFVVDLGSRMRDRLLARGVAPERLVTIPVWSRADEIEPVAPADNPLRSSLGLSDAFVVMYSGNAGLAHRFDEVLEAAELLRDEGVHFLFAGDGPRRREIEARVLARDLRNVTYRGYFPREDLRHSLGIGDLHLLTLRAGMAGVAVPGKLYGIMAAGRPVAVVAPAHSEPAETVMAEGIGAVVDPADGAGGERLAEVIRGYRDDPVLAAEHGRRAREAFLARYEASVACEAWTDLIERAARRPVPVRPGGSFPKTASP